RAAVLPAADLRALPPGPGRGVQRCGRDDGGGRTGVDARRQRWPGPLARGRGRAARRGGRGVGGVEGGRRMTPVSTAREAATAPTSAPRDDDTAAATRLADTVGRLVRMVRRSHVGSLGPASAAALATLVRTGAMRLGE